MKLINGPTWIALLVFGVMLIVSMGVGVCKMICIMRGVLHQKETHIAQREEKSKKKLNGRHLVIRDVGDECHEAESCLHGNDKSRTSVVADAATPTVSVCISEVARQLNVSEDVLRRMIFNLANKGDAV